MSRQEFYLELHQWVLNSNGSWTWLSILDCGSPRPIMATRTIHEDQTISCEVLSDWEVSIDQIHRVLTNYPGCSSDLLHSQLQSGLYKPIAAGVIPFAGVENRLTGSLQEWNQRAAAPDIRMLQWACVADHPERGMCGPEPILPREYHSYTSRHRRLFLRLRRWYISPAGAWAHSNLLPIEIVLAHGGTIHPGNTLADPERTPELWFTRRELDQIARQITPNGPECIVDAILEQLNEFVFHGTIPIDALDAVNLSPQIIEWFCFNDPYSPENHGGDPANAQVQESLPPAPATPAPQPEIRYSRHHNVANDTWRVLKRTHQEGEPDRREHVATFKDPSLADLLIGILERPTIAIEIRDGEVDSVTIPRGLRDWVDILEVDHDFSTTDPAITEIRDTADPHHITYVDDDGDHATVYVRPVDTRTWAGHYAEDRIITAFYANNNLCRPPDRNPT